MRHCTAGSYQLNPTLFTCVPIKLKAAQATQHKQEIEEEESYGNSRAIFCRGLKVAKAQLNVSTNRYNCQSVCINATLVDRYVRVDCPTR